jgi:hypothetical protein
LVHAFDQKGKIPRRRIKVTSSLYKISTDQLGNRVVVREGGVTPLYLTPFFKDNVNGFSSIADIYFMVLA